MAGLKPRPSVAVGEKSKLSAWYKLTKAADWKTRSYAFRAGFFRIPAENSSSKRRRECGEMGWRPNRMALYSRVNSIANGFTARFGIERANSSGV
jgi:hypothetical protein